MARESAHVGADTFSAIAADAPRLTVESYGVERYEDAGQWRWQLIDEDRPVIAASIETCPTRSAVEDTIDALKGDHRCVDSRDRPDCLRFHEDVDGWRWRLIDETGKELAESLVAYESWTEARIGMNTVQTYAPEARTSMAE